MATYTCTLAASETGETFTPGTSTAPVWNGASFRGLLVGIRLTPSASMDITISKPNGVVQNILAVTSVSSATVYKPAAEWQSTAAVASGLLTPFYIESSNLQFAIANATNPFTLTVVIEILE